MPEAAAKNVKVSSVNGSLAQVLKIISEESGLDLAELEPDADFADQGIDSLLSLTITGRIQEDLGLDLSASLFADYPTVKDLTNFFAEGSVDVESSDSSRDDEILQTPENGASSDSSETSLSSTTSSENLIECVRATIAEETRVSIAEVKSSTSFLELGMDSLLTLTIMGRLSEKLDLELPQTLLTDNDTLCEVEQALGLIPKTNGNEPMAGEQRQIFAHEADSPPDATSILLQGTPQSAEKTLFLFPDGAGSATSYASLSKISPAIAVYGLNCPWQKTPKEMKCSFEIAATKYLIEIKRRQPRGPYYFGGWSAGGICAYEAAQQLAQKGEDTARLILIDSPNPVGLQNPPERMYDFLDSLALFAKPGKAPPSWLRPHFNAFLKMLEDYEVKPFTGRRLDTHIIYARDGICKYASDPRPQMQPDDPREMLWLLNNRTEFGGDGWASLVGRQNLRVQVLDDVNHFSMVAPGPKIHELSAFIRRSMQ